MPRKRVSTTVYITPEQERQLKLLNGHTRVPVAEYVRQGIDMVLSKYADQLPLVESERGDIRVESEP